MDVKITENALCGCASGLSCVRYYAGTLSKTHAKAGQCSADIKDHFVDDTEWFASRVHG